MIHDIVKATGKVSILLTDALGNIKDERNIDNLVVLTGREFMASRMKDATAAVMSHMAVGTTNTAPAAGNVNLAAEVAASRTALTSTVVASNAITYACTFNPGVGTGALVEAGIFNYGTYTASPTTAQILLCRTIYAVINKGAADTLTISWTVTIS